MFKLLILALIGSATAGNLHYGGYGLGHGNIGTIGSGLALSGGHGLGLIGHGGPAIVGHSVGVGHSHGHLGVIPAAIHSRRSYDVVHVPVHQEPAQLTRVDVDAVENPVAIRFLSKSSPVLIDQVHIGGEPGRHEATNSVDEPHRLVHTVTRPVIQEVREIVQPYRRVVQEVRPVVEEVNTVVARGVPRVQEVIAAPAPVAIAAPVAIEAPIALAAPVAAIGGPVGIIESHSHIGGLVSDHGLGLSHGALGHGHGGVLLAGHGHGHGAHAGAY